MSPPSGLKLHSRCKFLPITVYSYMKRTINIFIKRVYKCIAYMIQNKKDTCLYIDLLLITGKYSFRKYTLFEGVLIVFHHRLYT